MFCKTGLPLSGPLATPGAAAARHEGRTSSQEGTDSDIQIDQEKKAAILGAMKNIQLDYIPPWALRISGNDFEKQVQAVVRERTGPRI